MKPTTAEIQEPTGKKILNWGLAGIVLMIVMLVGGCSSGQRSVVDDFDLSGLSEQDDKYLDAFTAYLDERIPALLDEYQVPGISMALIREGELVWAGAYGYADMARKRPMTIDTICRAESISKSVTAWGVMRLVEAGQIDLDVPVQQYLNNFVLPDSANDESAVTVRLLLSNNAGMPLGPIGEIAEYTPGTQMPTVQDYLQEEAYLAQQPGEGFIYSNVGYNLLELLVEEVTDRDFTEYMQAEVLHPLGMVNASYAWDKNIHAHMPYGYTQQGEPVPPYVYPVQAAGGLLADVEDIARFAIAGMEGEYANAQNVLGLESIQQIHSPALQIPGMFGMVADGYGFGHFVEILPDGRRSVWHGGQGHGWMTHFQIVPESGEGIVILTNSQRTWPFMAQVLNDWAQWSGIGAVKMSRIKYAKPAAQVMIILVLMGALWQVWRLAVGLAGGKRKFVPLAQEGRGARAARGLLALGVMAFVGWRVSLPYVFESSILLETANWIGIALFVLAVTMLFTSLFPRQR